MATSSAILTPPAVARRRAAAAVSAAVFFVIWMLFVFAALGSGAALFVVLAMLVVAIIWAVVGVRITTYLAWRDDKRSGRLWRVLGEAVAIGLVVAVAIWAMNPGAGGSAPTFGQRLVWVLVIAALMVANVFAAYGIAVVVQRMMAPAKIRSSSAKKPTSGSPKGSQ